jgi:hypothetical protein
VNGSLTTMMLFPERSTWTSTCGALSSSGIQYFAMSLNLIQSSPVSPQARF